MSMTHCDLCGDPWVSHDTVCKQQPPTCPKCGYPIGGPPGQVCYDEFVASGGMDALLDRLDAADKEGV